MSQRLWRMIEDMFITVETRPNMQKGENFVSPTILDFKSDFNAFYGSASMQDEIFGPILPVVRYQNLNRVIKEIRRREKPLALYCYTENAEEREAVLRGTTSGGAVVNDCMVHLANPDLPFGGVGMSGMGFVSWTSGDFHTFSSQVRLDSFHAW